MRAYQTIRFAEEPDILDIQKDGRKTCIGRIPRGEMTRTWTNHPRVVHNDRGYNRPTRKATVRRALKRKDKAAINRFEERAEA